MAEGNANRISYYSKKETTCPVDGTTFFREDILTGRGRLIAGDLTEDLRRNYEPSQKYGEVYPLIYPLTVCPGCYNAAFPSDFEEISNDTRENLDADTDRRIRSTQSILGELDFRESRTLFEGAGSYFLAMMCYDHYPKIVSPTVKQALCGIRAAWTFKDLHKREPSENYDYLSRLFYRKARFFYTLAIEYESDGVESIANVGNLGPDLDQNYGYDGVLYLASYLELLYGSQDPPEKREELLRRAKTTVARLFGMGKASKQKPSVLLDKARELYAQIAAELEDEDEEVDE